MGASGWNYFVQYQADVNIALQDLRQAIFSKGEYYKPHQSLLESIPKLIEQHPNLKEHFESNLEETKSKSKLPEDTIEQLLQKNGESGTHSIIDIFTISDTIDLNQSGKVSDEDLIEVFDTLKPSKSQVESKADHLQTYRGRWLCTYVIVYDDQGPCELFFTGYSGD